MRLFTLLAIAQALLVTVTALPSPIGHHEVLERRSETTHIASFSKIGRVDPAAIFPVSIAVKQKNLHHGHGFLLEVSDPASPKYGQHWTPDQVAKMFGPKSESVKSVYEWVVGAGIPKQDIRFSKSRSTLDFRTNVATLGRLLDTEYWVYESEEFKAIHLGCDDYKVPSSVVEYVDYITPTILFGQQAEIISKRTVYMKAPRSPQALNSGDPTPDLANCSASTTLDCIHALYNIPYPSPGEAPHPNNSFAIAGMSPNTWQQSDLDLFFASYFPELVGRPPQLALVDTYGKGNASHGAYQESNLDLMLSMPLAYPLNVTFIQVGDFGADEYLLEALDSSFCDNGTNWQSDDIEGYPDSSPGGYNKTDDCGTLKIPKIISTSYLSQEAYHTEPFMRRQCDEWLKLGLMGVTVLFCSGDQGVGGISNYCPHGNFDANYPASCPYITAVGATQLRPNSTIADGEIVCDDVIGSGGGFSNIFDMPSYQASQVNTWWNTKIDNYTQFNTSRLSRGFPDLSANGHQIEVVLGGKFTQMFGTSASTPLIGSLISKINDERLKMGKGSVGFINPTIYAHPEMFHDITEGSNSGCGTDGFHAIEGWDPATGMGTPDFPKMRDIFLKLP